MISRLIILILIILVIAIPSYYALNTIKYNKDEAVIHEAMKIVNVVNTLSLEGGCETIDLNIPSNTYILIRNGSIIAYGENVKREFNANIYVSTPLLLSGYAKLRICID